jgi:hypothetical protein
VTYGNERDIEIPFLLKNVKGPMILDVGKDKVGYTPMLEARGYTVESVDPDPSMKATYPGLFQDIWPPKTYDTVLLLSSLEHFDFSVYNLQSMQTDLYNLAKARLLLSKQGVIILTVPLGAEKIYGDFIQWSPDRVRMVRRAIRAKVITQKYARWDGQEYVFCEPQDCEGIEYRASIGAGAVYMAAWR